MMLTSMYTKQGGEYRLQPYKLPATGFCDAFNKDPYFFPEFAKVSNLTLPIPCPFPQVCIVILSLNLNFKEFERNISFQTTYMINGYRISVPPGLSVTMQTGEYAGKLEVVKDEQVRLELWAYFAIVRV